MIAGIFHKGSGLGNQLARYVFTRVKAADLGVDFGMVGVENFKGWSFLDLDMGKPVSNLEYEFIERRINNELGVDIRVLDARGESITDNTLVDGEFQAEKYFEHRLNEMQEWFKLKPSVKLKYMPYDVCVINFRGGEYVGVQDLFLTKDYWDGAIKMMLEKYPKMKFEVHTDDAVTARQFFPDYPIISDIAENWLAIRYASYLILSNSSFAIIPALLNTVNQLTIAPKYWARRNKGFWALPQNEYKKFTYI